MDAIRQIVQQRPDAVAELLEAYGVKAEPNERNLNNLVKVYGNAPLPYNNVTGNDSGQPKPTLFDKILNIANGLNNVSKSLKKSAVSVPGTLAVGTNTSNTQDPLATPRIFGINRTIFLVLAGLTVLAVGIILFKKS
ncbi:hypothetical protein [Pseudopedobacter beijingensis]|uniref:Uncharacterized protein n=1 Tax=Pseudopedobacter beijingensis TaxID=1207056 RepID=A0ABW4IIW2_9SPHI